jgi:MFS superfamily sulfate permease-like transporter
MRTTIRAIILFFIVLWLGGVLFFPIVAATAFSSLPDTHAAGTIVAKCLRILHYEGLFSGAIIVLLLLIAQVVKAMPRPVIAPVVMTLIMLALTAYSQFSIIPRMENYRIAAGGAIDAVPPDNPNRVAFNKLHGTSEHVEEGVLLAGVVLVVLLAWNYPKAEPAA